jgi:hypothetical protein
MAKALFFEFLTLLVLSLAREVCSQNVDNANTIKILALNGNSGKPLANVRFLVFGGGSDQGVKRHDVVTEFTTDGEGTAVLRIDPSMVTRLGVAPDFHAICLTEPDSGIFEVDRILERGLEMSNRCNRMVRREPQRGQFVVYARPETLVEQLRH